LIVIVISFIVIIFTDIFLTSRTHQVNRASRT